MLTLAAPACAAPPPPSSWTFTARFENDLFANTDRFYTNGIKLSWISPELHWFEDLPWLGAETKPGKLGRKLVRYLPFSREPGRQRNISFSIGQLMYTPADISRPELIPGDRPYAGWLYGSVAFHSKTFRHLDTVEVQAGFTGPWSLARQAQDLVHDLRGLDKARGWSNQIGTELAFAFVYEHKYRAIPRRDFYRQWGIDAVTHFGGAAGTAFIYADTGVEMRLGWNLPSDFGTGLIRPAGETDAPSDSRDPRYAPGRRAFSFYLFGAGGGRLVGRDIFLDGNTFSSSPRVDHKILVGEFIAGASATWRGFKLSYAQVLRTEEFNGQRGDQKFGSVSLSYTY